MLFVLLRRASPIWETSSLADLWRLGGRGAGLVAPVWHLFFKRNKSVSRPRFYYQPSVCDNWFIIIHLFVFSLNRRALLRFPSSPRLLLHPSSSHFPGAAAAASVSSVRYTAAMVDSPSAMKKTFSVPEIKPLDQYDFNRAKICASVRWLLSKSYGSAGTLQPLPTAEAHLGWGA